ncbi:SdpI family protein [Schaalia sp. Marseille-Q2122]|uniref:SdpI family protein n=1 Tax=Schaalia sp. Marseille-Q2122 TaxID=2736604 RepID=UPI00158E255E|nr:SdpI family protein [Schaalia sp. Marseille-Q2122]
MTILAIVCAVLFVFAAVRFGLLAHYARTDALPFESSMGIRAREVRSDVDTWNKAHRAAWPIYAAATGVSAGHGVACALAPWASGISMGGFLAVIVGAGVLVLVAMSILAEKAGVATVR